MATELKRSRRAGPKLGSAHRLLVVATNKIYRDVCTRQWKALPSDLRSGIEVVQTGSWHALADVMVSRPQPGPVLLISRLADIPEDAPPIAWADDRKHLVFIEHLPVEALSSRVPRLNIRDPRRLHIARESEPRAIAAVIRRAVRGLATWWRDGQKNGSRRIIDAWVEEDSLVVLVPPFERISVPLCELQATLGADSRKLSEFDVDEDGSFLYWPHADVHLGVRQLLTVIDPMAANEAEARSKAFNRQYGAAIRSVREQHGLKQSGISGFSERQIRRIEHGETPATSSALTTLAKAHGMKPTDYLKALADQMGRS